MVLYTTYTTLMGTARFIPFWRGFSLVMTIVWSYWTGDIFYTGVCFFTDAFLTDLSLVLPASQQDPTRGTINNRGFTSIKLISPLVITFVGYFIGSYPEEGQENAEWSRSLNR
jgi:hypothetical protein